MTVGGDDPVSECALPFTRNGVTHNDCTTVDAIDGKPWCSTGWYNSILHRKLKFYVCCFIDPFHLSNSK